MSGARQGLALIDQHAAHERINFDQVLRALSQGSVPQQALLLPVTIQLTSEQAAIIKGKIDEVRRAGFGLEEFGATTFKIDAVPAYLDAADLDALFVDIAHDFLQSNASTRAEEIRRRLALVIVCRMSVKFNQALTQQEMQALLNDLLATATPWTCPHGRPTMIVISFEELEKRFGRRE